LFGKPEEGRLRVNIVPTLWEEPVAVHVTAPPVEPDVAQLATKLPVVPLSLLFDRVTAFSAHV
jgi:hypothetical protein